MGACLLFGLILKLATYTHGCIKSPQHDSIECFMQGKAYGQMLADLELDNLPSLEDMANDYNMNTYAELS